MFNLSFITKKSFLIFLKKTNFLFVSIFNNLKFSNLKRLTKLFLLDKRVIFTLIIVFFSLFVHLSTPAFYKDSWVKGIVKNQFEKDLNLQVEFSDKLSYAIFPIPHFNFKDVRLTSQGENLAKIGTLKVYLTFSKFLDKNKMNIQNIIVKKAKFDFYKKDLKNLLNFYNKKINEKEFIISDSKVFLKNKDDDIYSIISIKKSKSFYDSLEMINKLNVNGEIFNNSFKLILKNDFEKNRSNLDVVFNKLNKRFTNSIDFTNQTKVGNLSYLDARKKYDTSYILNKNILKFNSREKIGDEFFYTGTVNLSPFYSNLKINLKRINLNDFLNRDSFFIEILKSNIFSNENLNFNIELKSKIISDHRKLKNLSLNINYENQLLNFNQSNLFFDNVLQIRLVDSEYRNSKKNQYFIGKFEVLINNYQDLYTFFQTKKEFRKKIDKINFHVKYDFLKDKLTFDKLTIDDENEEKFQKIINEFNQENKSLKSRVDLRNFFNLITEEL